MKYIVAIDEGTTSTRAVLYNLKKHAIVKQVNTPVGQVYPKPSFVEEDANEIYAHTLSSLIEVLESVDDLKEIAGIGITNQRETVIAWDKNTGKPLYNAIVWQCRRTAEYMKELSARYGSMIREKTGLVMDAYFSASKIKWLIDNVPEIKSKAEVGEVCFGTVDSYLIYKMTDGKAFVTDITNASRTMLVNIRTGEYDDELLGLFGIRKDSLPKIVACDEKVGEFVYNGVSIPICGIAGDQQAALVGQGCFEAGSGKVTYGTGLFMLYNLADKPIISENGLITTVAYKIQGKTAYAFEGSVFNAGSTINWLKDNLGLISTSAESAKAAYSVKDNGGVYFVPAFTGLGAPYWNSEARGEITGLTRGVTKEHIIRAALESMAYSTRDLAEIMQKESGVALSDLNCDGGVSANDFLLEFQAGVLGAKVNRPSEKESTVLGAAYLCGIGTGVISPEEIAGLRGVDKVFEPQNGFDYEKCYTEWKKAVSKCLYKGE